MNRPSQAICSSSVLRRSTPSARCASPAGSCSPEISASIILRPDLIRSLLATESILIPASSSVSGSRCPSLVRCSMSFLRYLVRCRSAATCASGMKLARSSPYSCSSAIHWQSVTSRLRPGTLRMCAALHTHTSIPAWTSAW